ncbi:zf-DHHC-domain-containing protein, partial [Atractiella rhizophila]
CETCETYRPPRCSHCRLCDNCVEHTDHHCTFLNNCIGRRNYTPFIAFLTSAVFLCQYVLALTIYHLVDVSNESEKGGFVVDWHTIGALIVGILALAACIPIAGLWSYHARLMWRNATTIEMVRLLPLISSCPLSSSGENGSDDGWWVNS